jgi:hypothetical protein
MLEVTSEQYAIVAWVLEDCWLIWRLERLERLKRLERLEHLLLDLAPCA